MSEDWLEAPKRNLTALVVQKTLTKFTNEKPQSVASIGLALADAIERGQHDDNEILARTFFVWAGCLPNLKEVDQWAAKGGSAAEIEAFKKAAIAITAVNPKTAKIAAFVVRRAIRLMSKQCHVTASMNAGAVRTWEQFEAEAARLPGHTFQEIYDLRFDTNLAGLAVYLKPFRRPTHQQRRQIASERAEQITLRRKRMEIEAEEVRGKELSEKDQRRQDDLINDASAVFGCDVAYVDKVGFVEDSKTIPAGEGVLVFHGAPKSGKTQLAVALGVEVCRKAPVVIFSGEGQSELMRRLAAAQAATGLDLKSQKLAVIPRGFDLVEKREFARELLTALMHRRFGGRSPALIIFDTLAMYYGANDENSTSAMSAFLDALKYLAGLNDCCVLVLHHGTNGARGSTALTGGADAVYRVIARPVNTIELQCTHIRYAEIQAPKSWKGRSVDFAALHGGAVSSLYFEHICAPTSSKATTESSCHSSTAEAIMALLKDMGQPGEWLVRKKVAEAAEERGVCKRSTVRARLNDLKIAGMVDLTHSQVLVISRDVDGVSSLEGGAGQQAEGENG